MIGVAFIEVDKLIADKFMAHVSWCTGVRPVIDRFP